MILDPKSGPKRQMRRLLKKEVSLDTYTWQKKYAHLTSNLVIPAVDERFKRRFSVSASMEEISKIPQSKDGQVRFFAIRLTIKKKIKRFSRVVWVKSKVR